MVKDKILKRKREHQRVSPCGVLSQLHHCDNDKYEVSLEDTDIHCDYISSLDVHKISLRDKKKSK